MIDKQLSELRSLINQYHESAYFPEGNGWSCVLCADIVIYFEGFRQPLKPNAQGILDFYNHSMELVKDDLKWVLINGEGKFRKVSKKVFDMVPFWLSPEGPEVGICGVNMQGGGQSATVESTRGSHSIGLPDRICS